MNRGRRPPSPAGGNDSPRTPSDTGRALLASSALPVLWPIADIRNNKDNRKESSACNTGGCREIISLPGVQGQRPRV